MPDSTSTPRVFREDGQALVKLAGAGRYYIFDFSRKPEVVAGQTLSSPTVPAVSGLTLSGEALLTSAEDGVPSGEGVKVLISSGTANTSYAVEARASASGGGTLAVRGTLNVE